MDNEKKYYKEIESRLSSGNTKTVLDTLKELRHTGTALHIPLITGLIREKSAPEVIEATHRFISDLKSQEVVPVLVNEISKGNFGKNLSLVLAACWESGLNFSNHLLPFAGFFIEGDYQASLEAFTVIEYSLPEANSRVKEECIQLLQEKNDHISEEKKPLYAELIRILKNIPDVSSLKISLFE